MLHKTLVAAFVVASGDALRIDGLSNRRAVVGTAASALSLVPLAAFAEPEELKKASDAEIYARADIGKLTKAKAIERTKAGDLADGSSATCDELDALISVDRKAVDAEKKAGEEPEVKEKLQAQINKLDGRRKEKGCASAGANLKKASDFEVYARADEGSLISARVVERAKAGRLVDGSGASLNELSRIISVDKKAIKLERERIEALGGLASMQDKKKLEASEKIIEAQVMRLENVRRQKRLEKDD